MENNSPQFRQMKQKLQKYEKMERVWQKQREMLKKSITLMQEQITKHKAINANLLKKATHKRSCSDEQTFIFNQTNISSYYPIVMVNKGHNWIPRANLRSHLDSVRVVYWQGSFLLSAGEDCLLKIWERDQLKITVRQHLAPIFTICGDNESIFTAGAEGVVRQWSVSAFLQNGRPVAQGQFHQDSIWQMAWNRVNRILVTSSADSSLKVIKSQNNKMQQVYHILTQPQTPTSLTYVSNEKIAAGFVESKKISIFSLQKTKKKNEIYFQSKQQYSQVNKLIYWNKIKMMISAHQDRTIRFFDPSTGKLIKNIVAHSDSVTSLCPRNSQPYQLLSCSHDGTLRIWDIRKYKCINDIGIHMQKYDESLLCIAFNNEDELVAVGGADGQIKLLSPQN